MTAQPAGPGHGLDTGSYEVIHLGGHAAVVVPLTWYRSGISPEGKPAADLPLTPAPGISATQGCPARIFPRLPGPLLRPR
jgi:hypothetical protein